MWFMVLTRASLLEAVNIDCLHLGQVRGQYVKEFAVTNPLFRWKSKLSLIISKPALQIYAHVEPEALTSYGQHKLDASKKMVWCLQIYKMLLKLNNVWWYILMCSQFEKPFHNSDNNKLEITVNTHLIFVNKEQLRFLYTVPSVVLKDN